MGVRARIEAAMSRCIDTVEGESTHEKSILGQPQWYSNTKSGQEWIQQKTKLFQTSWGNNSSKFQVNICKEI